MGKWWAMGAVCCALTAGAAQAQAQVDEPGYRKGWHLGMSVGADFPICAGVSFQLQMPARLRLVGGMGIVPQPFRELVNDALVSAGAVHPEVGGLVLESIESTRVRRLGLAVLPFGESGFYFETSYAGVSLKGGVPASQLTGAFIQGIGAEDPSEPRVLLDTTLHMLHPQLGWEWTIGRLYLRATVGGAFTLAAQSDVKAVAGEEGPSDLGPFDDVVEGYLDAGLRNRAHTPTAALQLGLWFF